MKKTNYIILALVLCFSIAFVVFPLRIFAGVNGAGEPGYDPSMDVETPVGPSEPSEPSEPEAFHIHIIICCKIPIK